MLESEGTREAAINVAEGRKQAQILASEGEKAEQINKAAGRLVSKSDVLPVWSKILERFDSCQRRVMNSRFLQVRLKQL